MEEESNKIKKLINYSLKKLHRNIILRETYIVYAQCITLYVYVELYSFILTCEKKIDFFTRIEYRNQKCGIQERHQWKAMFQRMSNRSPKNNIVRATLIPDFYRVEISKSVQS